MLADRDGAHPHVFSVGSGFSGFCCVSVMVASFKLAQCSTHPDSTGNPDDEAAFAVEVARLPPPPYCAKGSHGLHSSAADTFMKGQPDGCQKAKLRNGKARTIEEWHELETPREGNFDWFPLGQWPALGKSRRVSGLSAISNNPWV